MTVISFELRIAIVCAGSPSCHRKLLGAANVKWPCACNGCFKVFKTRVCVKSAVHVLRFDCAANHWLMNAFVSAAYAGKVNRSKQRQWSGFMFLAKLARSYTTDR